MSRKAALGSVLIALGLAFLGWTRFTRDGESRELGAEAATPDSGRNSATTLSGASAVSSSSSLETSNVEPSSTREPAPDLPSDPASTTELHGTVVVFDTSGTEHASEDGFFQLWSGEEHRVEVRQGHWSTRIPIESNVISIPRMEMAERTAISESTGTTAIFIPKDHTLDLRVLWPPSTILHVQAADTKLELDHVELVRQSRFEYSTKSHPGDYTSKDVVLANATSPIEFDLDKVEKEPLPGGAQTYYARSPGRAWGRVNVDFLSGGKKTLLLEPAADLEIVITGIDAPNRSWLRIRQRRGFSTYLEGEIPSAGRKQAVVESLAAGVHTVSVEIGDRGEVEPVSLARTEVDLPPGQRTTISLELVRPPQLAKVALEGVVVIPEEWGISEFRLGTELVKPTGGTDRYASLKSEQMKRVPGTPGTWAFSFPAVRPGLLDLRIHPPDWEVSIQVGDQGVKDARVEVPLPARVALRIVDRNSGEAAPIDRVRWRVHASQDLYSPATGYAKPGSGPGLFEFLAPSGTVSVSTEDERYEDFSKLITIEPGPNEIKLEIAKASGFFLRIQDGGTTKAFDERDVKARRLDGKGEWTSVRDQLVGKRFTVTAPGRYRLTVGDFEGCLSVPAREIQVESGRFVDVVIDLQHRP